MGDYNSSKIKDSVPATTKPWGVIPATFEVDVDTSLALNDTIDCVVIPKFAKVLDFFISVDDIDDATSLTLDVGDDLDDDRYVSASTVGQAAGHINVEDAGFVEGSLPYHNVDTDAGDETTDRTFRITVSAAAGTPAAGTIKGVVYYTMSDGYRENPAT